MQVTVLGKQEPLHAKTRRIASCTSMQTTAPGKTRTNACCSFHWKTRRIASSTCTQITVLDKIRTSACCITYSGTCTQITVLDRTRTTACCCTGRETRIIASCTCTQITVPAKTRTSACCSIGRENTCMQTNVPAKIRTSTCCSIHKNSITPKLHMLEDHVVPFLQRWNLGFGFLGEQNAESIHAQFNRNFENMKVATSKLEAILKQHLPKSAPSA